MLSSAERSKQHSQHRSPPKPDPTMYCRDRKGQRIIYANQNVSASESCIGASQWPPAQMTRADSLGLEEAQRLIARGAIDFYGCYEDMPHGRHRFYAIVGNGLFAEPDEIVNPPDRFTKSMSATLGDILDPQHPWDSLEHPSMKHSFGDGPGSITLNHWFGTFSDPQLSVKIDSSMKKREVGYSWLLNRIRQLELGLDTDVGTLVSDCYKLLLIYI